MKRFRTSIATATMIISILALFSARTASAQSYGGVSFDLFYQELSPYGVWEHDPHHGDIWFPYVEQDFRPYGTNGYWTMTEYGNTWVSNYPWGWAAFHYGRWVHTPYRGWGWIPGYEWGPAWVEWRSGNGYYGWAPMAPRMTVAVHVPINLWIFVPRRHIYATHIPRYWTYGRRNIYNRTTVINNTYIVNNHHYYGGPGRRDIERSVGRRVDVNTVRYTDRPGATRVDRNAVAVYRPDRSTRDSRPVAVRGTRDSDAGQTSASRNTDRRDVRASHKSSGRREMHIDRNGNVSMRDGNRSTGSNTARTTRNNAGEARRTVTTENPRTNRNVEQRSARPGATGGTVRQTPGTSTVDRTSRGAGGQRVQNARSNRPSTNPTPSAREQRAQRTAPAQPRSNGGSTASRSATGASSRSTVGRGASPQVSTPRSTSRPAVSSSRSGSTARGTASNRASSSDNTRNSSGSARGTR